MEYGKIIAVTGLPGLFELISSKSDGAIVRSLDDKSTRFVASRVHNFSHLESIEVFTTGDNVNLIEVFLAIRKSGKSLPDVKNNNALKQFFADVFPDLDQEKVYSSDMKKMVKWYEILTANNIELKLSAEETNETTDSAGADAEPAKVEKAPKAKATKSKTAKAEAAQVNAESEGAEKPAKKTAKKKKTEEGSDESAEEAPKKKTTRKKKSEE